MEPLLSLLIFIVVLGLIVWLLLWLVSYLPLPGPLPMIAKALIILIAVILIVRRAWPLLNSI
jgi:hypothetical protein